MIIIESHKVTDNQLPKRLLDFCLQNFRFLKTRSSIKKAIKKGLVKVDATELAGGVWLKSNQRVDLLESQISSHKIFEMKLEVIFEDNDIAVINKPAGIEVSGNKFKTIQNALAFNLKATDKKDKLSRPVPVHRLDFPTSGLLLCAKTHEAAANLGRQFEEKSINKIYFAIINGKLDGSGEINTTLEGKESLSLYKSIKNIPSLKAGQITLLELKPLTGRTHQLRKHLAGIGHPIVGDSLYNSDYPLLKGKGLFLCASKLNFIHPISGLPIELKIPLPTKFNSLIRREAIRFEKLRK